MAEHRIVVPGVVGSSPITHPTKDKGIGVTPVPFVLSIGASPSGKARDFDSRIRAFEPRHPSQRAGIAGPPYDSVAQSAEQLPFKQWVRGSNPRWVTKTL